MVMPIGPVKKEQMGNRNAQKQYEKIEETPENGEKKRKKKEEPTPAPKSSVFIWPK
jgi:hypothetical protein